MGSDGERATLAVRITGVLTSGSDGERTTLAVRITSVLTSGSDGERATLAVRITSVRHVDIGHGCCVLLLLFECYMLTLMSDTSVAYVS